MNRQEISEIKKLFQIKNCAITRICGCYVDGEKNIKAQWQQPFLAMDEEELFKYLDIFRKCLSGALGKTLTEVIPAADKAAGLQRLRDSKLKDPEQLNAFYQKIIDTYEYVGNYLILAIHDVYDIPGKTTDGQTMEDASDEVYEYIMACVCPVNLRKPGLSYNVDKQCFTHLDRDWVLAAPELAILYPAFNDRSEDLEKALYYTKTMDNEKQEFVEKVLGYTISLTPADERNTYNTIIEDVLGQDRTFADVREIIQITEDMAEGCSAFPQKDRIGVEDIRDVLEESGIKPEKIEQLDKVFNGEAGTGTELNLNNIVNRQNFVITTEHAKVSIKPQYKYDVALQYLNGQPCIVLEVRDKTIEVNGIQVNIARGGRL